MKKQGIIIFFLLLLLVGCSKKEEIPADLISGDRLSLQYSILDQDNLLIITKTNSTIFTISKQKETMVEGLNLDNIAQIRHVDIENKNYYMEESSDINMYSFDGVKLKTLDGSSNQIMYFDDVWIKSSYIPYDYNTEKPASETIIIYNNNFEKIQTFYGDIDYYLTNDKYKNGYTASIKEVILIDRDNGENLVYYYDKTENKFISTKIDVGTASIYFEQGYDGQLLSNGNQFYSLIDSTFRLLGNSVLKQQDIFSYRTYDSQGYTIEINSTVTNVYNFKNEFLFDFNPQNEVLFAVNQTHQTYAVTTDDAYLIYNYDREVLGSYNKSDFSYEFQADGYFLSLFALLIDDDLILSFDDTPFLLRDNTIYSLDYFKTLNTLSNGRIYGLGVIKYGDNLELYSQYEFVDITNTDIYEAYHESDTSDSHSFPFFTMDYFIDFYSFDDYQADVYNLQGELLYVGNVKQFRYLSTSSNRILLTSYDYSMDLFYNSEENIYILLELSFGSNLQD